MLPSPADCPFYLSFAAAGHIELAEIRPTVDASHHRRSSPPSLTSGLSLFRSIAGKCFRVLGMQRTRRIATSHTRRPSYHPPPAVSLSLSVGWARVLGFRVFDGGGRRSRGRGAGVGAQEEMAKGKAPPLLNEFSFPFSFCQILSPKEIAIT